MADMNIPALDETEFATLQREVAQEEERRRRLATIPGQIRDLLRAYVDGGGSLDDLVLEPAEPEPQPGPQPGLDYVPDPLADTQPVDEAVEGPSA